MSDHEMLDPLPEPEPEELTTTTEGEEPKPKDTPKEEPKPEEPEKKSLPGSQRQKLKAMRLEAEVEALKQQLQSLAQPKPSTPEEEPKLDDPRYASLEEYQQARDEYIAERARRDAYLQYVATNAQREAQIKQEAWNARVMETAKTDPEIVEIMGDFTDLGRHVYARNPVTANACWEFIRDSEAGPLLAKEIGSNPEEWAVKLEQMRPIQAVRELTRLEARLESKAPTTKNTTKAPPPPQPVKAAPAAAPEDGGRLKLY